MMFQGAVLPVHGAAESAHGFAHQRLRFGAGACGHHHAATFVAYRQRLPEAAGEMAHNGRIDLCGYGRSVLRATLLSGRHIRHAQQQAQVRWINGRGANLHHHFVGARRVDGDLMQRQLQLAVLRDQ